MPAADTDIRLVHMSDLHCDGSEPWSGAFASMSRCVRKLRPNALLITGDIVDHPREKLFKCFESALDRLYDLVEQESKECAEWIRKYTIVVSGNHDVAWFGNRLGFKPRRAAFDEFQARLLSRSEFKDSDEQVKSFYEETGIAVFPFDSNTSEGRSHILAAHGHIADLEHRMHALEMMFTRSTAPTQSRFSDATKIALLHHHPLPLPASTSDMAVEPFMLLDNANQFLRHATQVGIHLVLHGHRHVSSLCRFANPKFADNTMVVSSCGSSCKTSEYEREICLFTARSSGSIHKQSYVSSKFASEYQKQPDGIEAVSYAFRRKARAEASYAGTHGRIISVRSKTKVVRLIEDGSALVTIRMEGIDWQPDTRTTECDLREFIHGGIGRVVGGLMFWLDDDGDRSGAALQIPLPKQSRADQFEAFEIRVNEENLRPPSLPDGIEISYVLFNGYCLTVRDHLETFGSQLSEEVSSVEALYPTEFLELIVAFPNPDVMPKADRVMLDCWKWPTDHPVDDENITRKTYSLDVDETQYLLERDAVRHRGELCQVATLIRHPQPHRSYTLRWGLRNPPPLSLPLKQADQYWAFSKALQNRTVPFERWKAAEMRLESAFPEHGIYMRVYAFDPAKNRLNLIYPTVSGDTETTLMVGRGIVGHAFRQRKPAYFRSSGDRLSPMEHMGSEVDISEILAIPFLHPISYWTDSYTACQSATEVFDHVSGVVAVIRRADSMETVILDTKAYEDEERFIGLISRIVIDPLLEHVGHSKPDGATAR